jgi:hypothetical protein
LRQGNTSTHLWLGKRLHCCRLSSFVAEIRRQPDAAACCDAQSLKPHPAVECLLATHNHTHAITPDQQAYRPLPIARRLFLGFCCRVQNVAGYSISIIGAVFIGRLGPLLLSASVLANSLYNCTVGPRRGWRIGMWGRGGCTEFIQMRADAARACCGGASDTRGGLCGSTWALKDAVMGSREWQHA